LHDFYNIMYPDRKDSLSNMWKWLYRSDFNKNIIPLVILYYDRIIAHAGMIPFTLLWGKEHYIASWFVDIAVLPEFQRCGLASQLRKKRMEFSDICVSFCNEKSIGGLKKLGWIQSFDSYLHYFPISPFFHPRFMRNMPFYLCSILNAVANPLYKYIYSKYSVPIDKIKFDDINSNSLEIFTSPLNIQRDTNTIYAVRDSNYFSWRLINSPDVNKYTIISIDDVSVLIKLCDNYYSKYIDILLISDLSKYITIRKIISSVAIWGRKKGYYYICYYTSRKELSSYLRKSLKSFVRHPIFAYYSKYNLFLGKLKKANWNWDLIDSDFEKF